MPTLSSPDQTTITSFPQYVDKYLSICPRTVLFSGQLDGDPTLDSISGGIISFATKNTSGTYSDCLPGYTIDFGSSAGLDDIGKIRLRDIIDGTLIEVAETAFADVSIRDDIYFSVIEERTPLVELLRLQATTTGNSRFPNNFIEYHDYEEAYTNQNTAITPVVNITEDENNRFPPKYAGFLDDGETYRTVDLSSYFTEFMISGETRASTLWDLGDGTNLDLDTDTTIQATFPEGFRYISCTVVGTSGGSRTMYIPIWAHGDTFTPFSDSLRGFSVAADDTTDQGRKLSIRIHGQENQALEADIPEGTAYCYWEDEVIFDGTDAPAQYRRQMYGWSVNRQPSLEETDPVEIEIAGMGHWMNQLYGFSIQIEDTGRTPNKFFYMQNMNVDKVFHYILREFTTVCSLCNIYPSNIDTATSIERITRESVFSQIGSFVNSYKADLRCDTSGGFWVRKNINFMDAGEEYDTGSFFDDERASVDNIMTITDSMVKKGGVKIKFPAIKPVGRVDAVGSYDNGAQEEPGVVASRAPGKVTGQSNTSDSTPYIRLTGPESYAIFELNYMSGRFYANRIDPYQNIDIQLLGNMDVFEAAWGETIKLDLSPSNVGGLTIDSSWLFTINSIKVAHSNQFGQPSKAITLNVSRVTNGNPGVNIPIESIDWLENPFYDLFFSVSSVIPPREATTPQLGAYQNEIIGLCIAGEGDADAVVRTFTFDRGEPSWENITPSSVPGSRTLSMVDGRLDGSTMPIKALYYEGTTYEVYACANALLETPTWALEETGTLSGTNPEAPILVADKESNFWAIAWMAEDGVYLSRKTTGSWETPAIVGVSGGSLTVSGKYLGLGLRNGIIVCCGKPTTSTYGTYWATGLGTLTQISDGFSSPINSIKLDNQDSVYVSSFNDDLVDSPETPGFDYLTSDNVVVDPGLTGGPGYSLPDAQFVGGAQPVVEYHFDGKTYDTAEWNISITGEYQSPVYLGTEGTLPGTGFTVSWDATVYTNYQGEFVFSGTLEFDPNDPDTVAGYYTVVPGPYYIYKIHDETSGLSILADIFEDLPQPVAINYVKIEMYVNGTPPPAAGVYTIDWTLLLGGPSFDYTAIATNNSYFLRYDDFATSPVGNDLTPDDGYVPEKHNSIGVDSKNENYVSYHGTNGGITADQWVFTSQRGSRRISTSGLLFDFHKRAGPIYLAGGQGKLKLSIDRLAGLESRLGDMETVLGISGSNILNAMVIFGV
jgi:hypothetical protein